MLKMKGQPKYHFGDLIGDAETRKNMKTEGILGERDSHQWCSIITWRGIPSFAMELLNKHVNQSEIGIFEARSEALTYQMSRNTDLFIMKMEWEYQRLQEREFKITTIYK